MSAMKWARFDGMVWPAPCERLGDVEWLMRNGEPTMQDRLLAASVIAAYGELVRCNRDKRNRVVSELRRAARELGEE